MAARWRPDVFGAVAEPESVNLGLVVGSERALLVDTGSSPAQGAAVRGVGGGGHRSCR